MCGDAPTRILLFHFGIQITISKMGGPIYLNEIRYTQKSIGSCFQNGKSLKETISELKKTPELVKNFPPITLMLHSGHQWVVDGNRRLYVYLKVAEAGIAFVHYVKFKIHKYDRLKFTRKFTTDSFGEDVVLRGGVESEVGERVQSQMDKPEINETNANPPEVHVTSAATTTHVRPKVSRHQHPGIVSTTKSPTPRDCSPSYTPPLPKSHPSHNPHSRPDVPSSPAVPAFEQPRSPVFVGTKSLKKGAGLAGTANVAEDRTFRNVLSNDAISELIHNLSPDVESPVPDLSQDPHVLKILDILKDIPHDVNTPSTRQQSSVNFANGLPSRDKDPITMTRLYQCRLHYLRDHISRLEEQANDDLLRLVQLNNGYRIGSYMYALGQSHAREREEWAAIKNCSTCTQTRTSNRDLVQANADLIDLLEKERDQLSAKQQELTEALCYFEHIHTGCESEMMFLEDEKLELKQKLDTAQNYMVMIKEDQAEMKTLVGNLRAEIARDQEELATLRKKNKDLAARLVEQPSTLALDQLKQASNILRAGSTA